MKVANPEEQLQLQQAAQALFSENGGWYLISWALEALEDGALDAIRRNTSRVPDAVADIQAVERVKQSIRAIAAEYGVSND